MALKINLRSYKVNTPRKKMDVIFDVNNTLGFMNSDGSRPKNSPGDVALVQYLLKSVYSGGGIKPMGNLTVDGVYGPMTHYWSLFFMHHMEEKKYIDVSEKGGNIVPFHQKFHAGNLDNSMIFQLNHEVYERNFATFNDLEAKDSRFPALAKAGLVKVA